MYISRIFIENFRNFKVQEVAFKDGVNVIIGHNNAGKTNLIKALSLVIDHNGTKRLTVDDFNKHTTLNELKEKPPKISITITINKGKISHDDDLITISNWLTVLDEDYEATLTYEFFLPEKETANYLDAMSEVNSTDENYMDTAWNIIKHDFLRFYVTKIWGGTIANQNVADYESLQKFDFQFLNAIRDVERDMLTGRNTLLRDVFNFFIDYEIKSDLNKTIENKNKEIKDKRKLFSKQADELIKVLQERMKLGKDQILSYATSTGASFNNAAPTFEGSMSDVEMFSVLKLIVEYETGIKIPATHNGLGYNNLIYMSLLLAKMQVTADGDYMGSNAKVFSTLAIEEPEAHLHPAMQYKFLKFLKNNNNQKKVRQIFVTSHSTHITSAVSLDEIICLHNEEGITTIGYPGKTFPDEKSKKYVQRFLDATKSDMLFAQKVMLVEGIAEQILMSVFAQYIDESLEDSHIAVVNVGGRYFNHFLHLFDSTNLHTLKKKVICITDRDPVKSAKPKGKSKTCYPFEYNHDKTNYTYKNNASALLYKYRHHPNIKFYSQDAKLGRTLEFDLVMANPTLELLITDSMSNKRELKKLMTCISDPTKTVNDLIEILPKGTTSNPNNGNLSLINAINLSKWNDEDKKRAILSSRYLKSIGKGENALDLSNNLIDNFEKRDTEEYVSFEVPDYLKKSILSLCQK
jgi:putative ATP-dependent endonuclease of OLD family